MFDKKSNRQKELEQGRKIMAFFELLSFDKKLALFHYGQGLLANDMRSKCLANQGDVINGV